MMQCPNTQMVSESQSVVIILIYNTTSALLEIKWVAFDLDSFSGHLHVSSHLAIKHKSIDKRQPNDYCRKTNESWRINGSLRAIITFSEIDWKVFWLSVALQTYMLPLSIVSSLVWYLDLLTSPRASIRKSKSCESCWRWRWHATIFGVTAPW